MIKIFITITKIVVATIIAVVFSSCRVDVNSIEGSGKVSTQERNISEPFSSVEAKRGLDVIIEQSAQQSVIVEADDNVQQHITTKVNNGVLEISSDFNSFVNVKSKKITVRMPVIKSLSASSGVNMKSGNLLTGDKLTIDSSSGSSVKLEIEADSVIAESSSGSHITLSGKALSLDISASSGSQNNAQRLFANDVRAQASSGSNIDVQPIVSLDAKASSGASVDYHSTPKRLTKDESSGGNVSGN